MIEMALKIEMINMVLKTTQVCAHPHLLWHLNLCSHQKPTGVHPGILTSSRYFEFIQIFWVHPGIRWTTQYPYRWVNQTFVRKIFERPQLLSKKPIAQQKPMTSIEDTTASLSEVDFPSVTICNVNQVTITITMRWKWLRQLQFKQNHFCSKASDFEPMTLSGAAINLGKGWSDQ